MTQAYSEKEIPSSPNRSRTYDLPITSYLIFQVKFLFWHSGESTPFLLMWPRVTSGLGISGFPSPQKPTFLKLMRVQCEIQVLGMLSSTQVVKTKTILFNLLSTVCIRYLFIRVINWCIFCFGYMSSHWLN